MHNQFQFFQIFIATYISININIIETIFFSCLHSCIKISRDPSTNFPSIQIYLICSKCNTFVRIINNIEGEMEIMGAIIAFFYLYFCY